MTSSIYQYPLITYDVIDEVGKLSRNIFLKSFHHSRNLKKNFMRIGLLEKKLEGGGSNWPPPAMRSLGKQPAWRRVKGTKDPHPRGVIMYLNDPFSTKTMPYKVLIQIWFGVSQISQKKIGVSFLRVFRVFRSIYAP